MIVKNHSHSDVFKYCTIVVKHHAMLQYAILRNFNY